MKQDSLQTKFYQKELEVNALLEITQAVNNNLPEEDLYKIYEFTLRANLQMEKLCLFVMEEDWECKVQFGTTKDFTKITMGEACLQVRKPTFIESVSLEQPCFDEFEIIIPVLHKDRLLAFVFIKSKGEGVNVDTTFIQALSNIMLVAIENKRLARKQLEQQAFQRDMEIAKNVQNYLFPKDLPATDKIHIEAYYQPCRTVGGDYYDYITLEHENQFVVCIADVSGKGIPAAILMSNFQAVLRTISRTAENPIDVVKELNYQLCVNANRENFITFFLAVYDYEKKNLRYINAGHNPPLLMNGQPKIERLTTGTTVLGAFEPLPFIDMGCVENLEHFSLFLFTDGVTETFNENEEEFGNERLESFLIENYDTPLEELHKKLLTELNTFNAGKTFSDDLTFLSCKVNNASV
ncbi:MULTISPECIES: GAF domain-containing SpoIIE family protein phosphatase [Roseivirga]|uniref:GAF domain-containing SpoIIE family protein phosphatase n=1 Tax=Roseivirga TaxID=290180 RepID=UPI00257A444E|nr:MULTISPECIES: PP2C family protein-serine/threonine phosphatase [Roseivirga]|tara:strand:+ start:6989 stop:8215 length:1227 start_codon:yes stop_codon:yes gene_type:complete